MITLGAVCDNSVTTSTMAVPCGSSRFSGRCVCWKSVRVFQRRLHHLGIVKVDPLVIPTLLGAFSIHTLPGRDNSVIMIHT